MEGSAEAPTLHGLAALSLHATGQQTNVTYKCEWSGRLGTATLVSKSRGPPVRRRSPEWVRSDSLSSRLSCVAFPVKVDGAGGQHYGDGWEDRELTPEEVADFYKVVQAPWRLLANDAPATNGGRRTWL